MACQTLEQGQSCLLFRGKPPAAVCNGIPEYRNSTPQMLNELTKVNIMSIESCRQMAFRLQIRATREPLGKYSSHDLPTPYLRATSHLYQHYRPRLSDTSRVFDDVAVRMSVVCKCLFQWERLWQWLPAHSRILDPELSFSTWKHGQSLMNVIRSLWDQSHRPMIFVVETVEGESFGGFCPFSFRPDAEQYSGKNYFVGFVGFQKPLICLIRFCSH